MTGKALAMQTSCACYLHSSKSKKRYLGGTNLLHNAKFI